MKYVFLSFVLLASAALAQQPGDFSKKDKTAPPIPGVAQRLGATVAPIPNNRSGSATLGVTGASRVGLKPLRLRVVRDSVTGLPVYIERRSTKSASATNRNARLSAQAAASVTFQFLGQVRSLLRIANPDSQFTISRTETDDLGQMHVRLTQTHRGLPVLNSELVAHLTNGDVTLLNGRYQPVPDNTPTTPRLSLPDASALALRDVRKAATVRTFGDNLLKLKATEGELSVWPTAGGGAKLAYRLTVRPNLVENWEYVVDAQTGDILDKTNQTCTFVKKSLRNLPVVETNRSDATQPERSDLNTTLVPATGRDLNGVMRSLQTYQQGGTYYMIDTSRPMFKAATSKMPGDPDGAIWTVDARKTFGDDEKVYQITSGTNTDWNATAVSAHYNAGVAYDYYRTTFNRNALNGKGGTMISVINIVDDDGTALNNAYWNGKIMAYGNGDGRVFKPLAGGLDVAGHEMTHGVIQNAANLQYRNQSGAMNESFADVFGVMIDRDDWRIGEAVVIQTNFLPAGARRYRPTPKQGGHARDPNGYQPATMSQYVNTTEDEGGVHINSGIPNFAFYKFASAIGKDKAERVYYRVLTQYLVRTSQFADLRLAVIRAAGDLYGTAGAEVAAARRAFDEVGITETTQTTPPTRPDVPVASGQDLILLADAGSGVLYTTVVGSGSTFTKLSSQGLVQKPSVTDDGRLAYYVTTDKRIRAVNLTGTPSETVVSNETIWANVAISKDGTKLAALTAQREPKMYVYSFARRQWKEFQLYNPTYTQGIETGEVQYADSFEWDFSGENIVYDAYNALTNASGDAIDYWDVGFINVWSNSTANFAQGDIEKLFSNLDEGESIGNPTFSKNSPDVIAFDYYYEPDDEYYVIATNISRGNIVEVYKNNTLGFPSYSRQDNRLVFSTESNNSQNVSGISLQADKLTPSGSASVLYTGAKWPVWYTQATRTLPTKTAQSITFNAIRDRYANEGNLTLSATSSSGLPVSFELRSGPARLSGSTLQFTGAAGAVTVRAFQMGNAQFAAAAPVDRTFQVLLVLGEEPSLSHALSVYPNPVQQSLTVELSGTETLENVALRTLSGATVAQPVLRSRTRSATIDVGHLPKGLYLLQVQTPGGKAERKVLKE